MFNPHIEFEMSTITCNEKMKGTPNIKILVLRQKLNFAGKNRNIAFCATLWGTYGKRTRLA